jgi:nitric oxide reductase subunit B
VMTLALTGAGVAQSWLEHGLGEEFMDVQQKITLFYWVRLGGGVMVTCGLVLYLVALLVPGRARAASSVRFASAD